ncbi:hypothetical protein CVT24_010135, partial [Panaeolus cyanescens]
PPRPAPTAQPPRPAPAAQPPLPAPAAQPAPQTPNSHSGGNQHPNRSLLPPVQLEGDDALPNPVSGTGMMVTQPGEVAREQRFSFQRPLVSLVSQKRARGPEKDNGEHAKATKVVEQSTLQTRSTIHELKEQVKKAKDDVMEARAEQERIHAAWRSKENLWKEEGEKKDQQWKKDLDEMRTYMQEMKEERKKHAEGNQEILKAVEEAKDEAKRTREELQGVRGELQQVKHELEKEREGKEMAMAEVERLAGQVQLLDARLQDSNRQLEEAKGEVERVTGLLEARGPPTASTSLSQPQIFSTNALGQENCSDPLFLPDEEMEDLFPPPTPPQPPLQPRQPQPPPQQPPPPLQQSQPHVQAPLTQTQPPLLPQNQSQMQMQTQMQMRRTRRQTAGIPTQPSEETQPATAGEGRPQRYRKHRHTRAPKFKVPIRKPRSAGRRERSTWVREHLELLMSLGVTGTVKTARYFVSEYMSDNTPFQRMVAAYEDYPGYGPVPPGPQLEPMRPNFKNIDGNWNLALFELFKKYALENDYTTAGTLDELDAEELEDLFLGRLTTIRSDIVKMVPIGAENLEDAFERYKRDVQQVKLKRSRVSSRLEVLFDDRIIEAEAKRDEAFQRGDQDAFAKYQKLVAMLQELGKEGMSSDESEDGANGGTVYRARKPIWRSGEVDAMILEHFSHPTTKRNAYGNALPGTPTRTRIRGGTVPTRREPRAEWPRNFYKDSFFAGLTADLQRQLRVKPPFVF